MFCARRLVSGRLCSRLFFRDLQVPCLNLVYSPTRWNRSAWTLQPYCVGSGGPSAIFPGILRCLSAFSGSLALRRPRCAASKLRRSIGHRLPHEIQYSGTNPNRIQRFGAHCSSFQESCTCLAAYHESTAPPTDQSLMTTPPSLGTHIHIYGRIWNPSFPDEVGQQTTRLVKPSWRSSLGPRGARTLEPYDSMLAALDVSFRGGWKVVRGN